MTEQELIEVMQSDKIECKLSECDDCNVVLGLKIIRKYLPTMGIEGAEHDCIYSARLDEFVESGVTKEDAVKLRELNWMLDECEEGLACFV